MKEVVMTSTASTMARSRRRLRLCAAVGALLSIAALVLQAPRSAAAASSTDDWSTFHHDRMRTGVSADTTLGATAAAAGLTLKWQTPGGGGSHGVASITSSPALVHNATLGKTLLYVATSGTPALLDAIDASTGKILWNYTLGAGSQSSPAVAGNSVYIGDESHHLYAVDATTGTLQCSFDTGGRIQASPVVGMIDSSGPVVFVGDIGLTERSNAGHEWAINGYLNTNGSCTQRWVFNSWANKGPRGTRAGSWSSPALGTDAGGRQLLVIGSSDPDDSVYALDALTGAKVWRFQTTVAGGDEDVGAAPTISAPGVNGLTNGAVYVNGKDKIEFAIDLLTGSQIWQFNMGADSGVSTNSVSATCLVGNRVVVSYGNYTYALDAVSGSKTWRSPATAGLILSSPAVSGQSGDRAVFSGDLSGFEYAYRLTDGALLFQFSAGATAGIISSAAVTDGKVFFGTTKGRVVALG
jgi:outer membrane protein assembly factor BamB